MWCPQPSECISRPLLTGEVRERGTGLGQETTQGGANPSGGGLSSNNSEKVDASVADTVDDSKAASTTATITAQFYPFTSCSNLQRGIALPESRWGRLQTVCRVVHTRYIAMARSKYLSPNINTTPHAGRPWNISSLQLDRVNLDGWW